MALKRTELPYRKRFNPIHWAISYPLFAAAVLIAAVFFAVTGWIFARDFVLPGGYVVVDFYPINVTQTQGDITINYTRMTYRPGYRKRLSRWLEDRSEPILMIDGWIYNNGTEELGAFLDTPQRPAGVTFFGGPDGDTHWRARASGQHTCPATGTSVARTTPGLKRRMTIVLPASGGPTEWIKKSVENGVLPAHEIGALAFGDCEGAPGDQFQDKTVFRIEALDLPPPQEHDYYPFGAPTAGRTSVNNRPYWNIWMPRGNPE